MTDAAQLPSSTGRPFVIGLTGNIACGKSTVLNFLQDLGAVTIDADAVYHQLIAPGEPLWSQLVKHYGPSIVSDDQTINRRELGKLVFADPDALAELDRLTHPAVVAAIRDRLASSEGGVIVIDAVKLVESGLADSSDKVWVVTCDVAQQVERLIRRNGLSRADAEQRIAAQPPIEPKLERADIIIDNSGTLSATFHHVERAWRQAFQRATE